MTGLQHPMVVGYLARVAAAAVGLPPTIRAELIADLSAHLDSSLDPSATDEDVRRVLAELGDPDVVVAAAYEGLGVAQEREAMPARLASPGATRGSLWGAVEILAVGGLTVGVFLMPIFAPLLGLLMTWVSRRWTAKAKVVASLFVLGPALVFVIGEVVLARTGGLDWFDRGGTVLVGMPVVVLGPLVAGVYLATRLTRERNRSERSLGQLG